MHRKCSSYSGDRLSQRGNGNIYQISSLLSAMRTSFQRSYKCEEKHIQLGLTLKMPSLYISARWSFTYFFFGRIRNGYGARSILNSNMTKVLELW